MDVYFRPEYAQLCALIDGGTAQTFLYQTEDGVVRHQFIKREIPTLIDGERNYDIITPYGYGGPLVTCEDDAKRLSLIKGYEQAFAAYCVQHRIVSEFVRFHPLYNNALDFEEMYNAGAIRKTVGTNVAAYDDPVQSEFGKSCRKNIRKAINAGISYRVTRAPQSIDEFIDIYYSTMKRDEAADYYYFDKTYFETMLQLFREDLLYTEAIYEDRVIAANLCFVSDGNVHIHLSGTLSEYLYLSPAYILRYAVVLWAKEHGCSVIHHGGGTTNAADDPLFTFKKQFGKNTEFDFYIGKKIWDPKTYNQLCDLVGTPADQEFFPAYRKR